MPIRLLPAAAYAAALVMACSPPLRAADPAAAPPKAARPPPDLSPAERLNQQELDALQGPPRSAPASVIGAPLMLQSTDDIGRVR